MYFTKLSSCFNLNKGSIFCEKEWVLSLSFDIDFRANLGSCARFTIFSFNFVTQPTISLFLRLTFRYEIANKILAIGPVNFIYLSMDDSLLILDCFNFLRGVIIKVWLLPLVRFLFRFLNQRLGRRNLFPFLFSSLKQVLFNFVFFFFLGFAFFMISFLLKFLSILLGHLSHLFIILILFYGFMLLLNNLLRGPKIHLIILGIFLSLLLNLLLFGLLLILFKSSLLVLLDIFLTCL